MSSKENIMPYYEGAPVFTSQYAVEFEQLLDIFRLKEPMNILEIGVHHGGTLWHWINEAPDYARIVAVDNYHINSHLYSDWLTRPLHLVKVHGDSTALETTDKIIDDGPYDFVFIDGGHDFKTVNSDWATVQAALNENAIVAFHDILPHPHSEVSKLWDWIKKLELYKTQELISDPNQTGCGIGVVYV